MKIRFALLTVTVLFVILDVYFPAHLEVPLPHNVVDEANGVTMPVEIREPTKSRKVLLLGEPEPGKKTIVRRVKYDVYDQETLEQLARELPTPQAVADFMWKNFAYETDRRQFGRSEHWQSPEEFLKKGKGDCEDFALFAYDILKRNGTNAFVVSIYSLHNAHTVCVYEWDGVYHVLDGARVSAHKAKTVRELAAKMNPHWNQLAVIAFTN